MKFFQLSLKFYILVTLLLIASIACGITFGKLAIIPFALTFLIAAIGNLSLTARRLTDLGVRKWWALPILTLIGFGPILIEAEGSSFQTALPAILVILVVIILQLWLYLAKGEN